MLLSLSLFPFFHSYIFSLTFLFSLLPLPPLSSTVFFLFSIFPFLSLSFFPLFLFLFLSFLIFLSFSFSHSLFLSLCTVSLHDVDAHSSQYIYIFLVALSNLCYVCCFVFLKTFFSIVQGYVCLTYRPL